MKVEKYSWADSDLEKIQIEYDQATLIIWNDSVQKQLMVSCYGLAGITSLCIWDDTIILDVRVSSVTDENSEFVRELYSKYEKNYDYGGRSLSDGLLELQIELTNNTSFSVYCLSIEVTEINELKK